MILPRRAFTVASRDPTIPGHPPPKSTAQALEYFRFGHSQAPTPTATAIPASCAAMNAGTPAGAIPANVSESARATVTAGLAKDVDAVNQYAEVM
jgi:hypothetical protein